jgi:hypothetical protein
MGAIGNIVEFFGWVFTVLLILGAYSIPAGLVFTRTRLYLLRNTDTSKEDVLGSAVAAGAFWPITVPWFAMARLAGSVDPQTVAEKKALAAEAVAERETRLAEARTKQEKAQIAEVHAVNQRLRLLGEDIPYTQEERLAIEERENQAASNRLAIEERQRQPRYR